MWTDCAADGFVVCVCVCVFVCVCVCARARAREYVCVYSLLMSYIYGALSKARNFNAVCNGPTFGNADSRSYLLQIVSTPIQ